MKFDVCAPCLLPGLSGAEAVSKIAKAGFSAVEFWRLDASEIASVKAAANSAGVFITSLCLDDFRMNESGNEAAWLSALDKTIEKARALGAGTLVTQVGQDTGEDRRVQRDRIIALLRRAVSRLSDAGICVAIEPLNTLYDHVGTFLYSADEARDIALAADSPSVGITFDLYHQQAQCGNLINAFLRAQSVVKHIHIAGHPGRHEPWTGEVDYKNVFAALEKHGYAGYVGLEYIPSMEAGASLTRFLETYK